MTRKPKRRRVALSSALAQPDPLQLLRAARANSVITEEKYRLALRQLLSRAGLLLGVVTK
jgi:hypothetical protein